MRAPVFKCELKRDGAVVEAQEDQAQPAPLRGPVGDLGVELPRLRARDDRRSGVLLPAQPLELERLVEPADVLVDVEPYPALLVQPPAAAAQVTPETGAQAFVISLPVAFQPYQRRVLERADERPVAVLVRGSFELPDLARQRAQETERHLRR